MTGKASGLVDALDAADDSPLGRENERLRRKLETVTAELRASRSFVKELEGEASQLRTVANFLEQPISQSPTWSKPKKRKRDAAHSATVLTVLSDMHLDEVVNPKELRNVNAYNRQIAEARMERYFESVAWQAKNYINPKAIHWDGVHLMMPGDTVSGNIHDELRETNEASIPATILHWTPRIRDGIKFLADEFGAVHVSATPGNHGRGTHKPRAKGRAQDNADWLIASLIREELANDDRVTFTIPDGTDAMLKVYNQNFLLTHGDQTRGGGGIGGIWPPIMRMVAKKRAAYSAFGESFDMVVMGHWHQLIYAPEFIINGSVKGWDEYAAVMNFLPERAQQAFAVVTPENGITWTAPIFCDDRSDWKKAA